MFTGKWNRTFGMRFSTELAITGLPLAGQARMVVAVLPLELSLRATQCVDHSVGKRGEEFVCQRGMPG